MTLTKVKQLNGFVSAPAGTDLSQIVESLEENNIHVLDPSEFAPGAVRITDKIIDGIRHSDLVVAVLGMTSSNANVLFELGCAFALKKKILVILPEGYEVPSDIKDMVYIRSTPRNREAVGFALEQILASPEQEIGYGTRLLDRSKPLGDLAIDLLKRLKRLESFNDAPVERDIESIVCEMLEASGVVTRSQPQQKHTEIRPDFAVWIEELEPYFGNPILIEVKGRLNNAGQAKYAVDQVLHYTSVSNVLTVVVFSSQISSEALEVISLYPNLYFFDLRDFLIHLQQESLGSIIRDERNARVHGRLR